MYNVYEEMLDNVQGRKWIDMFKYFELIIRQTARIVCFFNNAKYGQFLSIISVTNTLS